MWSNVMSGAALGCAVVSYFFLLSYIRKTVRLRYELDRLRDILFREDPEVPLKKESDIYQYCVDHCGGHSSFHACPHSEDPQVRKHDSCDRRREDR